MWPSGLLWLRLFLVWLHDNITDPLITDAGGGGGKGGVVVVPGTLAPISPGSLVGTLHLVLLLERMIPLLLGSQLQGWDLPSDVPYGTGSK